MRSAADASGAAALQLNLVPFLVFLVIGTCR
jgi:hypothetical protein